MNKPKPDVPPSEAAVPSVPEFTPHINHAALRLHRTAIEIEGYDLGISALRTELTGIEKAANEQIATIQERLVEDSARINARIDDLELTRSMLAASIAVHDARKPQEEHNEADAKSTPSRTSQAGNPASDTREQDAGTGAQGN